MILSEAKTALANKLNIDIADITAGTNALFSDADFLQYIQTGVQLAWDYKPWTFTLDALYLTITADDIAAGYIDYPNTFEDNSVYMLTVAGKPWGKRVHTTYVAYFDENATATDEIYANFKRLLFLNANALSVGDEVVLYGKLRPSIISAANDKLPFSPENDNDENWVS